MTTITLNWVAAGGVNTTGQEIQYRKKGVSAWTSFQNVAPNVNTITITSLDDNFLYEFRILSKCSYGGPTESAIVTQGKITCPELAFTPEYNSISFALNHLGGHIDKYVVDSISPSGTVMNTWTFTEMNPVLTGQATPVEPLTTYRFRVTVYAGTVSKVCPIQEITTPEPPTCDPPINVIATLN